METKLDNIPENWKTYWGRGKTNRKRENKNDGHNQSKILDGENDRADNLNLAALVAKKRHRT